MTPRRHALIAALEKAGTHSPIAHAPHTSMQVLHTTVAPSSFRIRTQVLSRRLKPLKPLRTKHRLLSSTVGREAKRARCAGRWGSVRIPGWGSVHIPADGILGLSQQWDRGAPHVTCIPSEFAMRILADEDPRVSQQLGSVASLRFGISE